MKRSGLRVCFLFPNHQPGNLSVNRYDPTGPMICNAFGAPPLIKTRIPFAQAVEDFVTERHRMGLQLFHQRKANLQRFERSA
jgi:hypothetical protein